MNVSLKDFVRQYFVVSTVTRIAEPAPLPLHGNFTIYISASPKGRVQLRSAVHGGGGRPHPHRQALHDEPRPKRLCRLLIPKPRVYPTCIKTKLNCAFEMVELVVFWC